MPSHSESAEALSRSARMLRTALGPQIAAWLDDKEIVEIMLNPDGRLWLDRLTVGLEDAPFPTTQRLTANHQINKCFVIT